MMKKVIAVLISGLFASAAFAAAPAGEKVPFVPVKAEKAVPAEKTPVKTEKAAPAVPAAAKAVPAEKVPVKR